MNLFLHSGSISNGISVSVLSDISSFLGVRDLVVSFRACRASDVLPKWWRGIRVRRRGWRYNGGKFEVVTDILKRESDLGKVNVLVILKHLVLIVF